ncbi:MAG: hypothetical protein KBS85_02270, partial [Lachnospiraceae bacterium]|nr:hypothetical protein [Candidatus Merdinaster equi]
IEMVVCVKYGYTIAVDSTWYNRKMDLWKWYQSSSAGSKIASVTDRKKAFNDSYGKYIDAAKSGIEAYVEATNWITGTPNNLDEYFRSNNISSKMKLPAVYTKNPGPWMIDMNGKVIPFFTVKRGTGGYAFGGLVKTMYLDKAVGCFNKESDYHSYGMLGICSVVRNGGPKPPTPTFIPDAPVNNIADPPRPFYETMHSSTIFDISKAIPSNEKVQNNVRASSWTGDLGLFMGEGDVPYITAKNIYKFSITYSAKYESGRKTRTEEYGGSCGGIGGCTLSTPHTHQVDDGPTYANHTITQEFEYSAEAYYQAICDLDIRVIDSMLVENAVFPGHKIEYTKKDLANTNVTASVINYGSGITAINGSPIDKGSLSFSDVSHVMWAPQISNSSVSLGTYGSLSDAQNAINNRIGNDKVSFANQIGLNTQSWNDLVEINDNGKVLKFLDDTHVTGAVINGVTYGNTPAGKNENYTYGFGKIGMTMPEYVLSEKTAFAVANKTVTIPIGTRNSDYTSNDYPTGLTASYSEIFNLYPYDYTAGYAFGYEEHIYEHIMKEGLTGFGSEGHNGLDPNDGYAIRVHTPVISPFSIVFNNLFPAPASLQVPLFDFQLPDFFLFQKQELPLFHLVSL